MPDFHQHPDGLIYVRTTAATYSDTPENFELDFGVSLQPMPHGADEHIYTQGKRHCFMGDGDVIDGGPMPWPEGDKIIADVANGLAAQLARSTDGSNQDE